MILAQALPGTGEWAAAGGVLVLIIGALGVQINNWRKDKRDSELAARKDERERQQDEYKTRLFERIVVSNEQSVEKLAEIRVGQSQVCRHVPVIINQNNEKKENK